MEYLHKVYNNNKVTKNMKVRRDIDSEWALSFFVQLHELIQCRKMDDKDILDAAKLVKKHVQYLIL